MAKYTIHQAKTQCSMLLFKAAEGEEVIITNRDKLIAVSELTEKLSELVVWFLLGAIFYFLVDKKAPSRLVREAAI
jgi:hypothetical protein